MSHAFRIPRLARVLPFTVLAGLLLSGCGVNNIPTYDENAKAKWSDVQNQYQRRADLIPNLVETVKGYATQEREVLTQVTEARAKVSRSRLMPRPSPIRRSSSSSRMRRTRSPEHSGGCWLRSSAIRT